MTEKTTDTNAAASTTAATASASPAPASAANQPAAAAPAANTTTEMSAADRFEARMRALESNTNSTRQSAVRRIGDDGWMKKSAFDVAEGLKTGLVIGITFATAYCVAYGITKLVIGATGGTTKTE